MDVKLLKAFIKKYQGKYFKGKEIGFFDTYIFIRKIIQPDNVFHGSQILTYSDVIFFEKENVIFEHNRQWYFGEYYIKTYNYNRISKSEFDSILDKYGFEKPDKGDKEESYNSCTVEEHSL